MGEGPDIFINIPFDHFSKTSGVSAAAENSRKDDKKVKSIDNQQNRLANRYSEGEDAGQIVRGKSECFDNFPTAWLQGLISIQAKQH